MCFHAVGYLKCLNVSRKMQIFSKVWSIYMVHSSSHCCSQPVARRCSLGQLGVAIARELQSSALYIIGVLFFNSSDCVVYIAKSTSEMSLYFSIPESFKLLYRVDPLTSNIQQLFHPSESRKPAVALLHPYLLPWVVDQSFCAYSKHMALSMLSADY